MATKVTQVNANPTKEFFIHMLTRDIPLDRAIIDLVDNSVDAARGQAGDKGLNLFEIRISCSKEQFEISDNCGGFSREQAINYAFRFGRANDAPQPENAIGQFGVGMKRAIFKLGSLFQVSSRTGDESFEVTQDVDEWMSSDNWRFALSDLPRVPNAPKGAKVIVKRLHAGIAEKFELQHFVSDLGKQIRMAHAISLHLGLRIFLNDVSLAPYDFRLLETADIKPAIVRIKYGDVTVRIVAGVIDESSRSFSDGGWYVFCNNRLVLEADKTSKTGWGEESWGSKKDPVYHADFAFFRGYVFFEASDPSLLPWTTTKTGVDTDSGIYRTTREAMRRIVRPILTFLRNLAKDKSAEDGAGLADAFIREARMTTLDSLVESSQGKDRSFQAPDPSVRPTAPMTRRIQYDRSTEKVDVVKETLRASSLREVGELTFDYFFENECG